MNDKPSLFEIFFLLVSGFFFLYLHSNEMASIRTQKGWMTATATITDVEYGHYSRAFIVLFTDDEGQEVKAQLNNLSGKIVGDEVVIHYNPLAHNQVGSVDRKPHLLWIPALIFFIAGIGGLIYKVS